MNDPYSVLGISPSASDDEIKKAYRELSRKYHPDSYIDNPLSSLAEEKFKEVQEAYDKIMNERQGGYGNTQGTGSTASSSGYSQQDNIELQAAANYINSRHYSEALNVLSRIKNRPSQWYYLSAVANANTGNMIAAQNHIQTAVSMEPNNQQYTNLAQQLQWQGQRYQTQNYGPTRRPSYSTGNMCCDLWCADSCCECMGGDLCSCM